jgi:sulfite reductase (NADPH) flavoprotein alpha-component
VEPPPFGQGTTGDVVLMNFQVPVIPESAPFTLEQRAWLNGYLAGLMARGQVDPVAQRAPAASVVALRPLTILFGSQTGTAEGLAKRAAKEAGKRGFAPMTLDMAQTDLAKLAAEQNLLIITSTYGEGEPPDNAKALHAALQAANEKTLGAVRFSVCSLGDTNYVQFCQCGKEFDLWLERLGASRIAPRVDCDVEHEEKFASWLDAALNALAALGASDKGQVTSDKMSASPPVTDHPSLVTELGYSKKNPFPATVLTVRNLSGPGSAKEVNHVEISLEGSGLAYEVGDALGVVPQNCPALVAEVLAALGCDGEEAVTTPAGEMPLRRALAECYDLGKPAPELLALAGGGLQPDAIRASVHSAFAAVAPFHHVVDVLVAAPTKPSPKEFVATLKKIQPRLYSISSSPKAHPEQVHLTVGAVRYEKEGRARKGVCSTFLAERALSAGKVGVYVHANRAFRPPANGAVPVIMVGPGTGIAPFRAFLEERRATGATGKNWLFFGDQKSATDFLYREELAGMQATGLLTRLDLAFSRDQAEKIYVQHRMLENAAELYGWLEAGAHFYVCGDAARMAKDVDLALHQVIEQAGGKTPEAAANYVQALKASKRYARDVY